ncbi:hypothetical protein QIS99_28075 [Streptomyces sp. B-S-A8]|uniref:Uncharacterized protein n=1 Tax=Streptomyces solicavernae TaxID=3043614 RepID=A0ABT6S003_9ACTN|nr:hypothetical protein [Streptomyces sp. B-S-A8]MDI3390020.1 hypothetical protein [Streptomyces sp. B-S-A8]
MQQVPLITRFRETLKARYPQDDRGSSPISVFVGLGLLLAVVYAAGGVLLSHFPTDVVVAALGIGAFIVLLTLGLAKR